MIHDPDRPVKIAAAGRSTILAPHTTAEPLSFVDRTTTTTAERNGAPQVTLLTCGASNGE
jgi:hypothetical protein